MLIAHDHHRHRAGQLELSRADVVRLIEKSNELYRLISRNMTPSTKLFTLTSPPTARTVGSVDVERLAVYGVLVLLVALPIIVAAWLFHHRVREEEVAEGYVDPENA